MLVSRENQKKQILITINPKFIDPICALSKNLIFLERYQSELSINSRHLYYNNPNWQPFKSLTEELHLKYANFLIDLNSDINCIYLAERQRKSIMSGAFLGSIEIAKQASFCVWLLDQYAPQAVINHNFPHELFTYVLYKACNYFGVNYYIVHNSVLPWRTSISTLNSLNFPDKKQLINIISSTERESVDKYKATLTGRHSDAIPFQDQWLLKNQKIPLKFTEEFSQIKSGRIVYALARIFIKSRNFISYKKYIRMLPEEKEFVTYFMHYQPEETTIPRGGVFAQQLNVLIKLRSIIPPEIAIIIKENKATFRLAVTLAMQVRSEEFYRSISSIPNTYLVSDEIDTFYLIDKSISIATITGTVGLESLARGKRVIIFGSAGYSDYKNIIRGDLLTESIKRESLLANKLDIENQFRHNLLQELNYSCGVKEFNRASVAEDQDQSVIEAFRLLLSEISEL